MDNKIITSKSQAEEPPCQIGIIIRNKYGVFQTSALFNFKNPASLLLTMEHILPFLFQADTSEVELNTLLLKLGDSGVTIENKNKQRSDTYQRTGN
jgi:hypothetical protein